MGSFSRLARLYTFYTPIKRGRFRLAMVSLRLGGALPEQIIAKTRDGRRLFVNPSDEAYRYLYFTGEYEPGISEVISKSVASGDCCLDLGANLGWHTTLMMQLAGKKGQVHGFEPVPRTYERLRSNIDLNNRYESAFVNQVALGANEGVVEMILVDGVPDGHASVAATGTKSLDAIESKIITLDSYLKELRLESVNFVKVDIEGSELPMLRGAGNLFAQDVPPVFVIEMALATSVPFGYVPNDIIDFINSKRTYEYYVINETTGALKRFEKFGDSDIGANVLCVPSELSSERRGRLGI